MGNLPECHAIWRLSWMKRFPFASNIKASETGRLFRARSARNASRPAESSRRKIPTDFHILGHQILPLLQEKVVQRTETE
jgi:hypothetical protein